MFGLNPRSITSRISKMTYGINTLTTFDGERHPEEKKVIIEGERGGVTKGQNVSDMIFERSLIPIAAGRQRSLRLFKLSKLDPTTA